jgi:hypothetical protein
MTADLIFTLYSDKRTVFTFPEIAMLSGESDMARLKQRINYYVRTKKLINLRRGIYAKENYAPEELACKIFKPAYISLEYVLQKEGIVFQYNPVITVVSYLSRNLKIDNHQLHYRKIKDNILYNAAGITMSSTGISMATPERALLDKLYLDQAYYFDSTTALNKDKLVELLSVYQSARLEKTALTIIEHARY